MNGLGLDPELHLRKPSTNPQRTIQQIPRLVDSRAGDRFICRALAGSFYNEAHASGLIAPFGLLVVLLVVEGGFHQTQEQRHEHHNQDHEDHFDNGKQDAHIADGGQQAQDH